MTDNKTEALKLALGYMDGTLMTEHLTGYERKRHVMQSIREALAEQPAQQQCPHDFLMGDDEPGHDSVCMQCGAAVPNDEPAQQQEIDELTVQRDKLADILTRTANALKGQPAELSLHSWHDLPEVAQQLKAAQQQEPVAWGMPSAGDGFVVDCITPEEHDRVEGGYTIPLYEHPPASKPWVGLTDKEFQWIYDNGRTPAGMIEMAEAKLREKNV